MKEYNSPKVSILVPIFGVENYIEKCAVSLFQQTYYNLEYIFVDDCTLDKSLDVLYSVLQKYPDRRNQVRIIKHEHNKGLAAARNTAVAVATGTFVIHVDSDDYIEKDTVEKCVMKQQDNDADIISFGCYREYKYETVIQLPPLYSDSKDMCLSLIKKRKNGNIVNVGIWGRMIRKSLYTENQIMAEEGANMAEDYQVITRLSYYAQNIGLIMEPLAHYNLQNAGSYVNNITLKNARQSDKSYQIVFNFFINKGIDFSNAVYTGLSEHLFRMTVDGLNNHFGKDYYYQNVKKWNAVPQSIKLKMSMMRRFVFLNYELAKLYVLIIRYMKKFV